MEPTTAGKWMELLKEIAPQTKRAGLLFNPKTAPFADYWVGPFDAAANSFGVEPAAVKVDSESDLETAFAAQANRTNAGMIVMPDGFLNVADLRWRCAIVCRPFIRGVFLQSLEV